MLGREGGPKPFVQSLADRYTANFTLYNGIHRPLMFKVLFFA